MDSKVKEETAAPPGVAPPLAMANLIELSSSDSEDEGGGRGLEERSRVLDSRLSKRLKVEDHSILPVGFLDPFTSEDPPPESARSARPVHGSRQFWKAGDYEGSAVVDPTPFSGGMDHVRVHPKFLHSNATSHKWALGAFAELLDNSLDEVGNGATYVIVDVLVNKRDGTKMLLVEDNGGGMDPDKMRQCMSLGYSAKSKIANTIGQYGNGFKTSTMRLGADVVVFSRSRGKGQSPTQSIGMLSYTFLKNTGKEDIVVPMLDYEKSGNGWNKMSRSSSLDWQANLDTILQWSPYTTEAELLQQFSSMSDQGTRIVIYSLWEDDQGQLELDFEADKHDIQLRGVNRDEKKIQMARQFPNSRHFLTYRNSLRSYSSILYLRLPGFFRIILRGKDIEHHNIVTDMMLKQEVTYRPQPVSDVVPKDPNMVAVVTIGFVKDAKDHIDIQGFNVYHKNRLIKPFWRVWNAAGSDGRGVIGVLEANFVEPAHDKQGFERTTVLSRLESRLLQMQKTYWTTKCHKIGYAPRCSKKHIESEDRGSSPEAYKPSSKHSRKIASASTMSPVSKSQSKVHYTDKSSSDSNRKVGRTSASSKVANMKRDTNSGKNIRSTQSRSHKTLDSSDQSNDDIEYTPRAKFINEPGGSKASVASVNNATEETHVLHESVQDDRIATRSQSKVGTVICNEDGSSLVDYELNIRQLKNENEALKDRLIKMEESMVLELQHENDNAK